MNKRAAGTAGGIAAAVPAALFAALAGTVLHGQDVLVAGVEVPWGAAAALVLLGSVELWLGAAFRSVAPDGGLRRALLRAGRLVVDAGERKAPDHRRPGREHRGSTASRWSPSACWPGAGATGRPGPRRTPPAPRHPTPGGHAQSSRPARRDMPSLRGQGWTYWQHVHPLRPAAAHAPASLGPQPGTCPGLACWPRTCPLLSASCTIRDTGHVPARHGPRGMPFCT